MRPILLVVASAALLASWIAGCFTPPPDNFDGHIGCGTVLADTIRITRWGDRGGRNLPGDLHLPASLDPHDVRVCEQLGLRGRQAFNCSLGDVDPPFEIYKPRVSDTLFVLTDSLEMAFQIPTWTCQRQGSAPPAVRVEAARAYVTGWEIYFNVENGSADTLGASLCGAVVERAEGRAWVYHATVQCAHWDWLGTLATVPPGATGELWLSRRKARALVPGTYRLRMLLTRSDGSSLPDSARTTEPFVVLAADDADA